MKKEQFIKIIKWIPCAVVMCCIFSFSATPAVQSSMLSQSVTERLLHFLEKCFGMNLFTEEFIANAEYIVRKMAHAFEYFVLAITFFYGYSNKERKRVGAITLLFCIFYAASDEIHQLFVPGRSGQITDVGIDSLGAFLGVVFSLLFIICKKRFQRNGKKR